VGLYGVLSYTVAQRTQEIGVRMALGAQPAIVVVEVVPGARLLAVSGLVLGLAGAFALTRLLASFLFSVGPTDPATFAAVSLLLLLVAGLASFVPARRAANVDPVSVRGRMCRRRRADIGCILATKEAHDELAQVPTDNPGGSCRRVPNSNLRAG
jgi:hypothetical protein